VLANRVPAGLYLYLLDSGLPTYRWLYDPVAVEDGAPDPSPW
jgi:hypothetical protein